MRRIRSAFAVVTAGILLVAGYSFGTAAAEDSSDGRRKLSHAGTHHTGSGPVRAVEAENAPPAAGKSTAKARTPEKLLSLLGERIVAKDVDGIIALHEPEAALVDYDGSVVRGHKQIRAFYVEWFKSDPVLTVNPLQVVTAGGERGSDGRIKGRSASVMGTYSLEQTASDGTRESFSGNFCDIVRQQPDGTWLYVNDNPYPPHQ